jgi:hypothetical protein
MSCDENVARLLGSVKTSAMVVGMGKSCDSLLFGAVEQL